MHFGNTAKSANDKKKNFVIIKENGIFPRVQKINEWSNVIKQSSLNENGHHEDSLSLF